METYLSDEDIEDVAKRVYTNMRNEIAELKEKLHQHGKAIARIENWCDREPDDREYRKIERATLETVLRIFEEEGVK